MTPVINIQDARSGIADENLQEMLEAGSSAESAQQSGQNQYQTPRWLANALARLLIGNHHAHVLDPQCANGSLLGSFPSQERYGIDIDNRFKASLDGHVKHRL